MVYVAFPSLTPLWIFSDVQITDKNIRRERLKGLDVEGGDQAGLLGPKENLSLTRPCRVLAALNDLQGGSHCCGHLVVMSVAVPDSKRPRNTP